jgi:hypothetical protein
MSLVNDVLRQLDSRTTAPDHRRILHPPLDVTEGASSVSAQGISKKIFLMVIIVLTVIIVSQRVYPKPLLNLFASSIDAGIAEINNTMTGPISEPSIKVASIRAVAVDEFKPADNTVKLVDSAIFETKAIKSDRLTPTPLDSASSESKPKLVKASNISSAIVKTLTSNTTHFKVTEAKATDVAIIKAIEIPGLVEYEFALKSYQQKRFHRALEWINLAIIENKLEKFLILKARIFLQQKNADALYKFALLNSTITTQSWFELMAPSLQILSYHELSNQYYAQLIVQQPKMIKWQLAMALNYSKLGDNHKTFAIYKKVLNSPLASARQKQWLESQIVRLNRAQGNS